MTFSVAGVCAETGMLGCAITSSSICVASRCAFVRRGIGVALTQNVTNPDLGTSALEQMNDQTPNDEILKQLALEDADIQWRQLGLLNRAGEGAVFSGKHALGIFASAQGKNCIALGNLLENRGVPGAMIDNFETSEGHLAERLISALEAGIEAGGEEGPVQSAGVLVSAEMNWPVVDLRVDWHTQPIKELRMLWRNYLPQMNDFITRAKDPANAKSFGVAGDS